MQHELRVHACIERHVQALDKGVSTVRITRIVGLRHACYQMMNVTAVGIYRRHTDKKQIAPRNKRIGRPGDRLVLIHHLRGISERIMAQTTDVRSIHTFKMRIGLTGDDTGLVNLMHVFLPVCK